MRTKVLMTIPLTMLKCTDMIYCVVANDSIPCKSNNNKEKRKKTEEKKRVSMGQYKL